MKFKKKAKTHKEFNRFRQSTHFIVKDTETNEILLKTFDPLHAYEYFNNVCSHDKSRYIIIEK